MKHKDSDKSGLGKPLLISGFLHLVLICILVFSGHFTKEKPTPTGTMMQAVVIDPNLVRQQAQQIQTQRQAAAKKESERLEKLRQESERLEVNRQKEEARIKALQAQKARDEQAAKIAAQQAAKAEADRKAKEAAAKQAELQRIAQEKAAKAAAEKAKQEQAAAKRAEEQRIAQEKAAKEAAEKRKAEQAAAKAAAEKAKKQQEEALNNIFNGLESESKENQSAMAKAIASETDRYGAIYKQLIQQNLLVDDNYKGKSCRVNLNLIPAGKGAVVGSVKVLDGDTSVCAATRRAIAKVSLFPMPNDNPQVVNRLKNINLTVVPE